MTSEEILQAINSELTVPVWPTTGRALGVSRNSAYNGANPGDIPLQSTSGTASGFRLPGCVKSLG